MSRLLPRLALVLALPGLVGPAVASDEVEHYEGKPAKTLEQAMENLSEYNERLEAILAKEELTAGDMEQVHKLTYTLENALQRINSELADLAADLETVHIASEQRDGGTVTDKGEAYLTRARKLAE